MSGLLDAEMGGWFDRGMGGGMVGRMGVLLNEGMDGRMNARLDAGMVC